MGYGRSLSEILAIGSGSYILRNRATVTSLVFCSFPQTRTARAVFQFYPENSAQIELVTSQAMRAGFYGGLVVDYPHSTKAKKFFLVLMTGGDLPLPPALGEEGGSQVAVGKR